MKVENIVLFYLLTSSFFGFLASCLGLGVGLLFLSVTQSIGLAILCFFLGTVLGMTVGGKAILRNVIKTLREMDR